TMRTLPAAQLVPLPDYVSDETAAALMLKGMTAEYLLHRTHRVRPGDTVLVHAAAGGVGLLLCQWARALGARVVGTVSSEAKAELARANGCDHPIVTRTYSFAERTRQVSGGRGADVIYDGLGREAAQENLAALATRGHWVSYGQATGAPDPMNLSEKSATLSQPVLFHYTLEYLHQMAGHVFAALRDGILKPEVRRYPLAAAADAHRDLEARRTRGQIVLHVGPAAMVAGCRPLARLTCHAFDPRPCRIGDRHHRQPRDADQRKVLEGCVCLDFGERDRPRKPLDRCDIHRDVLSARVLRIRIGVGQCLRDPDHRLLTTGVVVEDAVALLDGAKMLLRQRVPDAAPDRCLVLHERVESVVGRFFLHQPVHCLSKRKE